MRPTLVIRFIVLTLVLLAGLTLISTFMAPGDSSGSSPTLSADVIGDRMVLAWSARGALRGTGTWGLSAIPLDRLTEWSQQEETSSGGLFSSGSSSGSASTNKAWFPARRGPDGELLGIGGFGDSTILMAFDGALHLQAVSHTDEEVLTGQPRVIRTTASTMGLPEDFRAQFTGFHLAGVSALPPSGGEPGSGTQTQPVAGGGTILSDQTDLLLTVVGLDRFTRLRMSQTTGLAVPVGPPCFLTLAKDQTLAITDIAPSVRTADDVRREQEELRKNPDKPKQPDTTEDLLPMIRGIAAMEVLGADGPDAATHADVFLSVAFDLVEGTDTPKLVRKFRFYWIRLRNGAWDQPVLIGDDITSFDVEADPADPELVHLVFVYDGPQALPVWKYRSLELRDDLEQLETAASDVTFSKDSRGPTPGLFDTVATPGQLHLFLVENSTGRPLHAMAVLPKAGDRRLDSLVFGRVRAIDAFRGNPAVDQINLVIFFMVVAFISVFGTLLIRGRRQGQAPPLGRGAPPPPDVDRDEPLDDKAGTDETDAASDAEANPPEPQAAPSRKKAGDDEMRALDMLDPEAMIEKFGYQPAGMSVRFFAVAVDLMILLVPLYLLAEYLQLNVDDLAVPFSPDFMPCYLLFWLLQVFYFSLLEYYFTRTPGKIVFGLHVRNEERDEVQLTYWQCLGRNLLRLVDYWVFFMMAFSDRSQRPGDRLAHTVVVRDPVPDEPADVDDSTRF